MADQLPPAVSSNFCNVNSDIIQSTNRLSNSRRLPLGEHQNRFRYLQFDDRFKISSEDRDELTDWLKSVSDLRTKF